MEFILLPLKYLLTLWFLWPVECDHQFGPDHTTMQTRLVGLLKNKTTLKNTLCSHLGLCLFGEWHYAFYLIFQICSFLIWKMRIALIVLGWPKGLFGCFRNIVWKTRKNFLANPVLNPYQYWSSGGSISKNSVQCIAQGQQSINLSIIKIKKSAEIQTSV